MKRRTRFRFEPDASSSFYKSVLSHKAKPIASSKVPSIQNANTSRDISKRNLRRSNFFRARSVAIIADNIAISIKATRKK